MRVTDLAEKSSGIGGDFDDGGSGNGGRYCDADGPSASAHRLGTYPGVFCSHSGHTVRPSPLRSCSEARAVADGRVGGAAAASPTVPGVEFSGIVPLGALMPPETATKATAVQLGYVRSISGGSLGRRSVPCCLVGAMIVGGVVVKQ